jgi:hypothetical protein
VVTQLFPRVAGLTVESPWQRGRPVLLRCTARLSRRITKREAELLRARLGVDASGDLLFYRCRPDEVEDSEKRIQETLSKILRRRA